MNADGLSLDLQFATDKTLTARKGPTPTFTRASTATFVGSNGLIQSAAINGARFDHDPITLACKGLLIEESRTNLALQSENHPSATWSKTGVTVASATNTSPSGSTTSNLVSEDSSTGLHRVFQSTAYVSGTSYAISVFLKYAGRQFVAITHPAVAANPFAIFDIQNGTISLSQSGVTTSITAYPNGWYRCVVNGVAATTASHSHIIQGSTTGGSLTGSYTGLNGAAFYIYGSQVEAGAFPTSYIPTTTASVVRSADICSISGSDFTGFYNQSEGTFLTQSTKTSTNSNAFIIHASDNSFVNGIDLRYATITSAQAVINVSSSGQVAAFTATVTSGSLVKQSMAYKLNDCAYSVNGASAITDTSALIPTVNRINFGTAYTGLPLNGHIASVRFYKKRLANAKLVTLTA